ncbi:hypothetical protein [Microbacterium lacticum]|uniref:hypothetical protein n=1 Tax=Microbacterium lacticum TaxID=33885 RepID=UPI0028D5CA00|nr:hypothetical protein [Microbacterium lacticum]
MTRADTRARLAMAQDSAAKTPIVAQVTPPPGMPEGFAAFAVGPLFGPRAIVVVPALAADAPPAIVDRLVARVLATATGTCPLCGRAAGLVGAPPPDPEHPQRGRAAYYASRLVVDVRHDEGCPAIFDDADARWFVLSRREGDR